MDVFKNVICTEIIEIITFSVLMWRWCVCAFSGDGVGIVPGKQQPCGL